MSRENQIEEMARKMCRVYQQDGNCASNDEPCGLECVYGYCAERIYCAGYRKQSEVIRCKDCNYFREYSSEYARTTENADGDCHIRIMNSNNEQYFACQYNDFCSFAKMKGGEE